MSKKWGGRAKQSANDMPKDALSSAETYGSWRNTGTPLYPILNTNGKPNRSGGAGMIYAQGIAEYASILSAIGGGILGGVTSLTNLEPSWNILLIAGVFGFLFWLIVFKM